MKKYVAFFDLDKTIIDVNSARLIALFAYQNKLLSKQDIISGLYFAALYKTRLISTKFLMEIMTKWLKNVNMEQLTRLFEDLGVHIVENKIREQAKKKLDFHKQQGAKAVILSASVQDICEPVRQYLKMDDIICTVMEINNHRYTGNVAGNYCYAEEKLSRVIEYCTKHQLNIEDAWYYADSLSDISVLSAVGHPVCVSPDRKLKKYAQKNDWPIEIW